MKRSQFLLTLAGICALPIALKSRPKNEPVIVQGLNGNLYLVYPDHLHLINNAYPECMVGNHGQVLTMKSGNPDYDKDTV